MEKLSFFDETFYWSRSGKRATVIEVECELTQRVNPDTLRITFAKTFFQNWPQEVDMVFSPTGSKAWAAQMLEKIRNANKSK